MDHAALPPAADGRRSAGMRFTMIVMLIERVSIVLTVPLLPAFFGSFTPSLAAQVFWVGEAACAVNSPVALRDVIAPALATPLMGVVSHLPPADSRVGAPMDFSAEHRSQDAAHAAAFTARSTA